MKKVEKLTICVGDLIEFNYFGQLKQGRVTVIGKHGYWINNIVGCVGNSSIRCPFGKNIKLFKEKSFN